MISTKGLSSLGTVLFGGAVRFATSPLRDLPDFVVIGVQKGGTTSLHHYLAQHPHVTMGMSRKEQHFFDTHYHRGLLWYRTDFPLRMLNNFRHNKNGTHRVIGEGTPNYIFHPRVPERMASILPEAKLIVILRNPAERAISHYFHNMRHGFEHLALDEALSKESERLEGERNRMMSDEGYRSTSYLRHSYLSRGRYAEQLEQWLQYYPRKQFLLVCSEDLFRAPQETIDQVFAFLGCKPHLVNAERKYNKFPLPRVENRIREWLLEYFRPYNAQLSELGFKPDWE
jgi:hypothetical protein